MSKNTLTIILSDDTLARLKAKALAMGVTPEALAADLIEQAMFDLDRAEALDGVREPEPHYDADEPTRPWDEVRPELEALIHRTFGTAA